MVLKLRHLLACVVITIAIFTSSQTVDAALTVRHLSWAIWTLILFVLAAKDLNVIRLRIFMFMAGFFILTAITLRGNISEGVYELCKVAVMIIFIFAAVNIIDDIKKFSSAMMVLALGLGIYGLWLLTQQPAGTVTGTMCGRNLWSVALFLLLPFCFMVPARRGIPSVIAVITVIVIMVNLLFLGTRAVAVAMTVSVITVSIQKRSCVPFMILVLCIAAFIVGNNLNSQSLQNRLSQWSDSIGMWWNRGFVGAGNWPIVYPLYKSGIWQEARKVRIFIQRPHNDFIWILAEIGLGGLCLYLGIFACGIYYAVKSRLVYIAAGIAGYMTIAFFSFPKERAFASIILCVYLAMAIREYWDKCSSTRFEKLLRNILGWRRHVLLWKPSTWPPWLISACVICVLSFCVYDFWVRYRTEKMMSAVYAARTVDEPQIVKWLIDDNYHPLATLNNKGTPVLWFRGLANEKLDNIDKAIVDYTEALKCNPNHIFVINNLGTVLLKRGRFADANSLFDRALDIQPEFRQAQKNRKTVGKWIEAKSKLEGWLNKNVWVEDK